MIYSTRIHPSFTPSSLVKLLTFPFLITEVEVRYYFVCCRTGKYLGNTKPRKTLEKRPHQKETRKINSTCISRMYVDELENGQVSVHYVSAHTGHDLGPQKLKHLPLPNSTKEEVSLKIGMGIPPERILQGRQDLRCWLQYSQ